MKGVDTEYLALFDLKLVAGKWFGPENVQREGFNGFVVNEKLVKQLGLHAPVGAGQNPAHQRRQGPVIGVVRDFTTIRSRRRSARACMMPGAVSLTMPTSGCSQWRGNGTHLPQTLAAVESAWREVFPDGFYRYDFLDDQLAKLYTIENLIFKGILVFAGLAIFISALGLYGLVTFMAVQRTKEVASARCSGRRCRASWRCSAGSSSGLVGLAFAVAAPLAAYLMQAWLEGFSYRVALHPFMFAGALLGALGIAALTIGYQATRAAVANPVKALRDE
jgi:hypothetical protein